MDGIVYLHGLFKVGKYIYMKDLKQIWPIKDALEITKNILLKLAKGLKIKKTKGRLLGEMVRREKENVNKIRLIW